VADRDAELAALRTEREWEVSALSALLEQERAELARVKTMLAAAPKKDAESAHDGALESLRAEMDRAREEAVARVRAELETQRESERREFETKRDEAVATARRDSQERIAALEARVSELTNHLARARESLDAERRYRLVEDAETADRMDALETQIASQAEELKKATSDLETSRAEIAELEGEIVVLRGELATMRRQAEQDATSARAANEQLEHERALLERAKALLEKVSGGETPS
jgi:chromosome segregation ATPase